MEYIFKNCKNLDFIHLDNFDTRNVEDIRGMFSGCSKLKMLDLSSFNTTKIKYYCYNNFLLDCVSIKFIDLSSFEYHGFSPIYIGKLIENGTMIVKKEFYEKLEPKPIGMRIIFVD